MYRFTLLLLAALTLVFGTSCLRTSSVVKVKKDGTGTIVARYHFSPEMLAMIDQLGALGGALSGIQGGAAGGPDFGLIQKMAKPEEASLREDAASYGEGVRYVRHEAGKDEDGWDGYTVEYAFDDINKVRLDMNTMPGKAKEFAKSAGEELRGDQGGGLTFSLVGDLLTVKSSFAKEGMEGLVDQEQIDQARKMGMPPSEAMKMGAGMTKGMRIGYFLRVEDGIAETDADHVTDNLITLSDAEVSKVLLDPDFGAFVDKVATDPGAITPESYKELISKLEALTIESKEEIKVKLK